MYRVALTGLTLLFVSAGVARAAEDPNGTWKWTMGNNQTRETTLKLKLDGDQLTGAISGRNNQETAIRKGHLQGWRYCLQRDDRTQRSKAHQ